MTKRDIADKDMLCAACGTGFVFSIGEQELFRLRGIESSPSHCPDCARGRVLRGLLRSRTERPSA